MARETTPAPKAGTVTPPTPEDGGTEEEHVEVDTPVTRKEFESIVARVTGQSGVLSKISSTLEKLSKPAVVEETKKEDPTLTKRVTELEAKEKVARDRAARQAISAALLTEGGDPAVVGKHAKYLLSEFSHKIQVSQDDEVSVIDGETPVPVDKFLHAFLASADGQWLLPAKRPPNDSKAAKGVGTPNAGGKLVIAGSVYRRGVFDSKTRKVIESGNFEIDNDA